MRHRSVLRAVAWLVLCCAWGAALAQQELRATLFAEADRALAAARAANAELLAPTAFNRGLEAYAAAENDLARGRNMERVRTALANAVNAFDTSVQAAEIASVNLASLIKTRADASNAHADRFAAEQWSRASQLFDAAARRLESGDIRGARSRADEAEALYRDAELIAIKAQYLSQTRALLAQAEQMRVPRLAPNTFAKARGLLEQAEVELENNRYDTDLPRSLAQQANYEARHAIYLAQLIDRMRNDGRSLEDIVLSYEKPLAQIGAAADIAVQLDNGVAPVTEQLVAYVEGLRERAAQVESDLASSL
jgi:OOP family OmpA-OmpF porin